MKTTKTKKMNMGGAACGPKKMANGGMAGGKRKAKETGKASYTSGPLNVSVSKRQHSATTARPKVGVKITKEPKPIAPVKTKPKTSKSTVTKYKNTRSL
jgi:hypothetical protein